MLVKLSSQGHVVLPKTVREALGIGSGTVLKIACQEGKIVLEPVSPSMIDHLYGKFAGEPLLTDVESEHREELRRENRS
jgi:AbrB family looped-hinge helix DNA binding protein